MLGERDRQRWKIELIASENYVVRGGDGGPGLVADQQVRRGPARQALLRRLRVRRRGRAARPGARAGPVPGRRARQRPAALRRAGQHGRVLLRAPARRPGPGHEPGPRRPPDARHRRSTSPASCTRSTPTASRGRPSASTTTRSSAGARGPPEADRRRRVRLPADHRLRADGRDRPRGRRAAVRGHGAHRRARRGGRPSEPVPARRPRHDDHPQDAARPPRRPDLQPRRAARRASTRPTSRRSRRRSRRPSTRPSSRASRAAR